MVQAVLVGSEVGGGGRSEVLAVGLVVSVRR